jgi:uncharacterized Zn finger protein (UPF0148 family)
MEILKTSCPHCGSPLEFPRDFGNVICAACGTAYLVREHKGAINLSAIQKRADDESRPRTEPNGSGTLATLEAKLGQLDEEIAEVGSEIEAIRSREKAAPLQAGCAFFGLFGLVILVLATFMTVARDYFGRWPFYLSLAAVVAFGLLRMRRKMASPDLLDRLRADRLRLEEALAELEKERDRLEGLKEKVAPSRLEASPQEDSA